MPNLDYTNSPGRIESDADCLAGAIIGKSNQEGYLECGDLGNRRERIAAFQNGLKNGPRLCMLGIPAMPRSTRSPWLPPLP